MTGWPVYLMDEGSKGIVVCGTGSGNLGELLGNSGRNYPSAYPNIVGNCGGSSNVCFRSTSLLTYSNSNGYYFDVGRLVRQWTNFDSDNLLHGPHASAITIGKSRTGREGFVRESRRSSLIIFRRLLV